MRNRFQANSGAVKSEKKKQLERLNTLIDSLEKKGQDIPSTLLEAKDKLLKETSRNKFNARAIIIDGVKYDSTLEGKYKLFLDKLKDINFEYHKKITLLPKNGLRYRFSVPGIKFDENIQDIELETDFFIEDFVIVDVKGGEATKTDSFINKFKLLKNIYKERFVYVLVSSEADFEKTLPKILIAVQFKKRLEADGLWQEYKDSFFNTTDSFLNETHRINTEQLFR